MYFWLKVFHISAMAIWFSALFFFPRLFVGHASSGTRADTDHLNALGKTLYFGIMTPAGVITVVLGIVLIAYGFTGPWLPAKLSLVAVVVMLHLYYGKLLVDISNDRTRHGPLFYRLVSWAPVVLFLGIAALAAAKPGSLPPLGGVG